MIGRNILFFLIFLSFSTVCWASNYTLSLYAANGKITKNPDLTNYAPGSTVKLTAIADPGYYFDSWSGQGIAQNDLTKNPLTVVMDTHKTITVNFQPKFMKVNSWDPPNRIPISAFASIAGLNPSDIFSELKNKKYIYYSGEITSSSVGDITDKFKSLNITNLSTFDIDSRFNLYKSQIFEILNSYYKIKNYEYAVNLYWGTWGTYQAVAANAFVELLSRPDSNRVIRISGEFAAPSRQMNDIADYRISANNPKFVTVKNFYINLFNYLKNPGNGKQGIDSITMMVFDVENFYDVWKMMNENYVDVDGVKGAKSCSVSSNTLDSSLALEIRKILERYEYTLNDDGTVLIPSEILNLNPSDFNCPDGWNNEARSVNAWNEWAYQINTEFYKKAIIEPFKAVYPTAKVSQYGEVFSSEALTISNGLPYFQYKMGDVSSPTLYPFGPGHKYASNPSLVKIIPWNLFIDLLNTSRHALKESQEVVPWVSFPGYQLSNNKTDEARRINYWFQEQMFAHLAESGIERALLWNPSSWPSTPIAYPIPSDSNMFQSNLINKYLVKDKKVNLEIIPFDADEITTGNFTTTYEDFLAHYTLSYQIKNDVKTNNITCSQCGKIQLSVDLGDNSAALIKDGSSAGLEFRGYSWVTMRALPNPGYRFLNWTGDFNSTNPNQKILLNQNWNITGNFLLDMVITQQPNSQKVLVGDKVVFSVAATGTVLFWKNDFEYQWMKDGKIIPNATKRIFEIKSVKKEDAGYYSVKVTGQYTSLTSRFVSLSTYQNTNIKAKSFKSARNILY